MINLSLNAVQKLPRLAYTSEHWLDLEKEVFKQQWHFVAVESDIKKAGDFMTTKVGDYPIVLVRGADEEVRAFHNLCRHRGTELFEGKGNAGKLIVCPYHRWTYNLTGALKGVPAQKDCFPGVDKSKNGLKELGIGFYQGLIFVKPTRAEQSEFEQSLAGLPIIPHKIGEDNLEEVDPLTYEIDCNWKVFYENAIDGYHLGYLHEKTLGRGLTPNTNVWEAFGRHLVWYSTERDGQKHALPDLIRAQAKSYGLQAVPGFEKGNYPGVLALFPTTILTPSPYGLSVSKLIPLGANKMRLEVRSWEGVTGVLGKIFRESAENVPGFDPKTGVISSRNWKKHALDFNDFQSEDIWVCEKMQRSLNSPAYEVAALAQGAGAEAPLMHFQSSILDFIDNKEVDKLNV